MLTQGTCGDGAAADRLIGPPEARPCLRTWRLCMASS